MKVIKRVFKKGITHHYILLEISLALILIVLLLLLIFL